MPSRLVCDETPRGVSLATEAILEVIAPIRLPERPFSLVCGSQPLRHAQKSIHLKAVDKGRWLTTSAMFLILTSSVFLSVRHFLRSVNNRELERDGVLTIDLLCGGIFDIWVRLSDWKRSIKWICLVRRWPFSY